MGRAKKSDDAPATQSPGGRASKRSRKTSPAPSSQCDLDASANNDGRCAVSAAPTVATSAHKYIQMMTCQSLKKNGADIVQC